MIIGAVAPQAIPGITAWGKFGFAMAGGAVAGGINDGLRGAAIGAVAAGAFFGIGQSFQAAANSPGGLTTSQFVVKTVAHGAVGGTAAVAAGGEFHHGFLAAGVTQAFSGRIDNIGGDNFGGLMARTAAAATIGGTASVISGGSFANGAITGAFSYLFGNLARRGALGQQSAGQESIYGRTDGFESWSFDEDYIREEVYLFQVDITGGQNDGVTAGGYSMIVGKYRHYVVVGYSGNPLSYSRFLLESGDFTSTSVDAFTGFDLGAGASAIRLIGSPSTLSGVGISWNASVGPYSVSLVWNSSGNFVGWGAGTTVSPLPVSGSAFVSNTNFVHNYRYFSGKNTYVEFRNNNVKNGKHLFYEN